VFRSIRGPLGRIVLLALLATWATVADTSDAIYEPAGTLRRACDSKEKVGSEICFVFVVTTLEIAVNNRIYGLTVCPPSHTNGQRAVKIAKTWLNGHPEDELLSCIAGCHGCARGGLSLQWTSALKLPPPRGTANDRSGAGPCR
jgi:hypothetical protein